MAFEPIYDRPGEPTIFLGSADDVAGTDEEINEIMPGAAAGTIITSPGYASMKQKGLDNTWTSL